MELRCIVCQEIREYKLNTAKKCKGCGLSGKLTDWLIPPNFTIPANCTYDGKAKCSSSTGQKQQAIVPINIIDKNPDGSVAKVTRIGKKSDIENE